MLFCYEAVTTYEAYLVCKGGVLDNCTTGLINIQEINLLGFSAAKIGSQIKLHFAAQV